MGDRAMRADGGVAALARGGKAKEDKEDTTEGMESYTAKPNKVEEEAEGAEHKRGGRAKRADGGGVAARARGGRMADKEHHETEAEEKAEEERKKRARGGALRHVEMEGTKTKHRRLDRPGRKRGGGVGADMNPLSSAARTRSATAHSADADELEE